MSNLGVQISLNGCIFVLMSTFGAQLLKWYEVNRRDLPWRQTQHPYIVWLSEIILQQTRVAQGTPYFERFLQQYPTVIDMAEAHEDDVLKLWQGLGYYARARNMLKTAKIVAFQLGGIFPATYKELLQLPGIGPYTASAIASICYNEVTAVVDGNVYRVLARYFDIDLPINQPRGIKEFQKLAQSLITSNVPGTYNQALMEFGALQCTPKNPNCLRCPLTDHCLSYANKTVDIRPQKIKPKPARKRYFHYLIPLDKNQNTLLIRRSASDIWEGLYEFPLIEAKQNLSEQDLRAHNDLPTWANDATWTRFNEEAIVHRLSHQILHAYFWILDDVAEPMPVNWDFVYRRGVPRLIERFLQKFER